MVMMRDQEIRELIRFGVYLGNDAYFSLPGDNHKTNLENRRELNCANARG